MKLTTGEMVLSNGVLQFELYDDDAPGTAANFKKLALSGYYDGLSFHRVIPGFVTQGGCPDGSGSGGPGYSIPCETSGTKQIHDKGILSMAHRGFNTGGSQFFICHSRAQTAHLDRVHTCFGRITEGLDLIEQIKQGDRITKVTIHQ
jgi:peptidyl-prolyl cis-trans isomerase B (cyclophilin B)